MSFAEDLAAMGREVVAGLAGGSVTLRVAAGAQLGGSGRHGYQAAEISDTVRAVKLPETAVELTGAAPMGGRIVGFRIATGDLVNLTAGDLREGLRLNWDSDLGAAHDLADLKVAEAQPGAQGATVVLVCTPSSSRDAG